MRRDAIRYTVAALLVGLLAACGQKPDEGKPAPESKPDSSGFTVPDKELGLDYYRANAAVIAAALDEAGVWYCGGKNSPYIWLRCPNEMGSWEFFDWLLEHAHVVGTPGEGFGPCGKGYFRLTAFGDAERTKEAAARIKAALATL